MLAMKKLEKWSGAITTMASSLAAEAAVFNAAAASRKACRGAAGAAWVKAAMPGAWLIAAANSRDPIQASLWPSSR